VSLHIPVGAGSIMRKLSKVSIALGLAAVACSGASPSGFATGSNGQDGQAPGTGQGGDGGLELADSQSGVEGGGGNTTGTPVIYADTDTALYSVDPVTKAVTPIGTFAGMGGGSGDDTMTDLAVNAEGDIYVNTETAVYRVTLPASPGSVPVTKVATIATTKDQSFYALAFAPPGVLGTGEMLVGGDGSGEVWAIDSATGATEDLGNFGRDPSDSSRIFGVSGDIVFYTDSTGKPTGLATIRSCTSSGSSCDKTDDYLAGIDMTALVNAFTSHTPAASLLAGIYGGSASSAGGGTGYGELFGLGAWEGDVYAFSRAGSSGSPPPQLVLVDTGTGTGTVAATSSSFTSGGWSGAGVSTKTTITIPPPPPPPK
jgi:hypothetical protein